VAKVASSAGAITGRRLCRGRIASQHAVDVVGCREEASMIRDSIDVVSARDGLT